MQIVEATKASLRKTVNSLETLDNWPDNWSDLEISNAISPATTLFTNRLPGILLMSRSDWLHCHWLAVSPFYGCDNLKKQPRPQGQKGR